MKNKNTHRREILSKLDISESKQIGNKTSQGRESAPVNDFDMTVKDVISGLVATDNGDVVKLYNKKEDKYYNINYVGVSTRTGEEGFASIEFNWGK